MKRRSKWRFLWLLPSIVACLTGILFVFSPYRSNTFYSGKAVVSSVVINATPQEVYTYLGNSAHARQWSVFVDHITTLNEDSIHDGAVGSRRRCFCRADEQGMQWDELTTINEKDTKRRLLIYRLVHFALTADGLATEQIYTPLSNHKCRLTFTVFFENKPGFIDDFNMHFAAWYIHYILDRNLANIKRLNEQAAVL